MVGVCLDGPEGNLRLKSCQTGFPHSSLISRDSSLVTRHWLRCYHPRPVLLQVNPIWCWEAGEKPARPPPLYPATTRREGDSPHCGTPREGCPRRMTRKP